MKKKVIAFLIAASMLCKTVLPAYAGEMTLGKEQLKNVGIEEQVAVLVEENTEDGTQNYILGREMTEEEVAAQKAMIPELRAMEPLELDTKDLYAGMEIMAFEEYEERYDLREQNLLTSVKDQNPWGTCWAFSTIALLESSLISQGVATKDNIDLSERHLAYFTGNTGYDALGNASEDTIYHANEDYYLNSGGTIVNATMRLMNWQGAAEEESYPYSNSNVVPEDIEQSKAQDIVATVKDVYFIPTNGASTEEETAVIKNLIKTYGCVWWSYYHDDAYYNYDTAAYNCNQDITINHAITLVGWDDSYAKENFRQDSRPENDGAWIVRNSWSEDFGDDGYFYMSYEDATLGQGNDAGVLVATESGQYDNNYFYSNGIYYTYWDNTWEMSQVFEAKSGAEQEVLKAVSFMLGSAGETYEIQVYKNPQKVDGVVVNPESGEAAYGTPISGETGYAGLYTVDIPPVILEKGDTFAVVITFTDADGAAVYLDQTDTESAQIYGTAETVNITAAGQSFRHPNRHESGYDWGWEDLHERNMSARMNAMTVDVSEDTPVLSYKVIQPEDYEDTKKNQINWTQCTNVDKYEVYKAEGDEGEFLKVGEVSDETFEYVDELLLEQWNKNYFYKIKARLKDGSIAESDIIKVASNSNIKMSEVSVYAQERDNYLSWKQVLGADGYEIERRLTTETEFEPLAVIEQVDTLSYVDAYEGTDGRYEYRVRAYKTGSIYTAWSDIVTSANVKVELTYKENNAGTKETYFQVGLETMEGVSNYKVVVWLGGSGWIWNVPVGETSISIGTQPFKIGENPAIGEELKFEVRAYDTSGNQITTDFYKEVKVFWTPIPVENVSHQLEDNVATFTWTGAENAEFIDVYRSNNENRPGKIPYKTLDLTQKTDFIDAGLQSGTTYYYRFISGVVNEAGEKVYSDAFLYAVETEKMPHKVVFDYGDNNVIEEVVEEGKAVEKPVDPTRSGYIFEGWYLKNSTTEYDFTLPVESALELIAKWTVDKSELQSVVNANKDKTQGSYTDESWSKFTTALAKAIEVVGKAEVTPEEVNNAKTALMNAVSGLQKAMYTVSFDTDGGSQVSSQTIEKGTKATKPTANPTKTGYIFAGWYVGNTEFDFATKITGNITIKAKWTVDKSELQSVVNANKDREKGDCSEESWSVFESALVNAQNVLAKANATVSEVTAAKNALEVAVSGLTLEWRDILYEDRTGLTEIPDGIWIAGITDKDYSNGKQQQEFRVYDGNVMLEEGIDYTVSYKNNQNAYEYKDEDLLKYEELLKVDSSIKQYKSFEAKKAPQVAVTMKGNYKGKHTEYFKIIPRKISECIAEELSAVYNQKIQKPKPVFYWNGKTLQNGKDYTYEITTYPGNKTECKEAGEYILTVKGKGNFTGIRTISYVITEPQSQIAMSKVKVDKILAQNWLTAGAKPEVTVRYNNETLEKNTDYTLEYRDNTSVGTGYVLVKGKGNYTGTKVVSFKINGVAMKQVCVEGVNQEGYSYTGENVDLLKADSGIVIRNGQIPLDETDYTVSYKNNLKAGTATMILTGNPKKGYTGSKSVKYRIVTKSLKDVSVGWSKEYAMKDGVSQVPFMKGGTKPEVVVKDGNNDLIPGKDYTVSYKNNSQPEQLATLTVKGKGNYTGATEIKYLIVVKDTSAEQNLVSISVKDKVYNTGNYGWKQSFKVCDENGKVLDKNDAELTNAEYTIKSLPKGAQEGLTQGQQLNPKDAEDKKVVLPVGTLIQIKVKLKGNYSGEVIGEYRILEKNHDISKAQIDIEPQKYTGKEIVLGKENEKDVKVIIKALKDDKGNVIPLVMDTDYEILKDSYQKNIAKGTAKVTIRGIGNFGGEKTVSFKIGQRSIADWFIDIFR